METSKKNARVDIGTDELSMFELSTREVWRDKLVSGNVM